MSDRPRCTATKNDGSECRGFALGDTGLCFAHTGSADDRRERAARAGQVRAVRVRERKARESLGFRPGIALPEAYAIVAKALVADFTDAGLPGEADWSTRLLALSVLVAMFPKDYATTPEDARTLIERALPESIKRTSERIEADKMYTRLRREWDRANIRQSPLGTLYVAAYPAHLIAPWESVEEVQKERPDLANVQPIKALDGTLLAERKDEPGLVDVVTVDA